ncbi:MAG TPA: nucleoside recognition domain-containing protein [Rectinemataceae bacterium]
MNPPDRKGLQARFASALGKAFGKSLSTVVFLLKIMIPTSLIVALLGWSGLLAILARYLSPIMRLVGLPGEAALVFISGALLNNYSAIAVMGSLVLSLRDATILAVMCLIAHNLIVETAVMKSAGSSALKMALLRLGTALVAAFLLNLLMPKALADTAFSSGLAARQLPFWSMLGSWGFSTLKLVGKITLFVFGIMIVQALFEEFRVMDFLSRILAPFMKFFGLPAEASFLWIVINVVGYTYGAGIIKAEYESGRMKKQDGDLFNHHAAICHSLVEDTILYMALSVPLFWIIVPRLGLAIVVVWLERLRRGSFKRSFRAGTV